MKRKHRECRGPGQRFEELEPRCLLSAAPRITEILAHSDDWSMAFTDELRETGQGEGGVRLGAAAGAADLLPWQNVNQLTIKFDKEVFVTPADLVLRGAVHEQPLPLSAGGFVYNSATFAATWTFATRLPADKFVITVGDNIQDAEGNALDGEGNIGAAFPTGDGTAGGSLVFRFDVLPGDLNRSGRVDLRDGVLLRAAFNARLGDANDTASYDIDGSGVVDTADDMVIRDMLFRTLPAAEPDPSAPLAFHVRSHTPLPWPGIAPVEINVDQNGYQQELRRVLISLDGP